MVFSAARCRAMICPDSSLRKAPSVSGCPSMRRMMAGGYGVLPYYCWKWIVGFVGPQTLHPRGNFCKRGWWRAHWVPGNRVKFSKLGVPGSKRSRGGWGKSIRPPTPLASACAPKRMGRSRITTAEPRTMTANANSPQNPGRRVPGSGDDSIGEMPSVRRAGLAWD